MSRWLIILDYFLCFDIPTIFRTVRVRPTNIIKNSKPGVNKVAGPGELVDVVED